MNSIQLILFCATFATPFTTYAQSCDNPQSSEAVRIYFVNGMNNTFLSTKKVDGQFIEQDMVTYISGWTTRDDPVISCN